MQEQENSVRQCVFVYEIAKEIGRDRDTLLATARRNNMKLTKIRNPESGQLAWAVGLDDARKLLKTKDREVYEIVHPSELLS